jgi:hypothetical protein
MVLARGWWQVAEASETLAIFQPGANDKWNWQAETKPS